MLQPSIAIMKKRLFHPRVVLAAAGFLFAGQVVGQSLQVNDLTAEYQHNPIGLDIAQPRLSWKLKSPERATLQKSYEVRVSTSPSINGGKGRVWDSGVIKTDQSVQVVYSGPALHAQTRYYWQVRVADNHGHTSPWSEAAFWQTGLLSPADWTAKWITTFKGDTTLGPSPYFRKSFTFNKPVKAATVYVTAHGLYEARLNGRKIGTDFFTPGWTSYRKRLLYQTYDVTSLVKAGANTIGLSIGDGWYKGHLAFEGHHSFFGSQLSGLLQLEIEFTDGTKQVVQTDDSWKYAYGPIRMSDLYNGETYDARLELKGWDENGYNDTRWKPVALVPPGAETLLAGNSSPARKHEVFAARQIITTPKGETVIDFGQNLVGWVQFKVKGAAGKTFTIEHGEVLDKAGNFYNANLRSAKEQVTYTLKGGAVETYEPLLS